MHRSWFSAVLILLAWNAQAARIQILHTNDFHAQLDPSGIHGLGGYAAVKRVLDERRGVALRDSMPSVHLNGGDFLEGSLYYALDEGETVTRILDALGVDVLTLGNHDWLLGAKRLGEMLNRVSPRFALIAANYLPKDEAPALRARMKPYVEIERAGVRIAVLGITTDNLIFKWSAAGAKLEDPVATARKYLPELRARNDVVIAMNHLGMKWDREFIHETEGVDLLIGAHSHDVTREPIYELNARGLPVPMVQAGEFGEHVGELVLDVTTQGMRVVSETIYDVDAAKGEDPRIAEMVREARTRLERQFTSPWLHEVLGHTDVPLESRKTSITPWAMWVAEAFRGAGKTEISVDTHGFHGPGIPVGAITREVLVESYPRYLDPEARESWSLYRGEVMGLFLKIAIEQGYSTGYPLVFAGVTYDLEQDADGHFAPKNIRVNGRDLNWMRNYTITIPEGLARGATEASPFSAIVFGKTERLPVTVWEALEKRMLEGGTPLF